MSTRPDRQTTEPDGEWNGRGRTRRLPGAVASALLATAVSALLAVGVAGAAGTATASSVSAASNAHFGTILVSGTTLYTLKPSGVACTAKCLKVWPQLLLPAGVTSATAGPGVNAVKLGTMTLKGGGLQVTYGGKPLYWFYKDTSPGQVKGNIKDTWGTWSVVVLAKAKGSHAGSGTGTGTSSGSGSAGTGGVSF
jgi:predicted lipoprotein with Yx(FWY)xxD motif